MMRWVVWINGLPLLLGENVAPTEENVNRARRAMGQKPLGVYDAVNGVSPVHMMAFGNELTAKYPEPR